jgi:alkaline phosphatase D
MADEWIASMQRRRLLAAGALAAASASIASGCGSLAPSTSATGAPVVLDHSKPLTRIAFGSCADQKLPQPIWDTVLQARPDLVVYGGDNVYASDPPFSIANLENAYATAAAIPAFQRLRAAVPQLAVWDDHDFGVNDGGAGFAFKNESKNAFLNFWSAPASDARRTRDGVYDSHMIGPPGQRVQIILLDGRWFKSGWKVTDQRGQPGKERYLPDADPTKTMLGEAQWRWLAEQLKQPADVRLIVSGIQVVVEGHGWERWGNFPLEQQRLTDLIRETRANGVVFLSGDRHIGALYRDADRVPYPLYEMTSSGITHPWKDANEAGPNRIGALVTEQHFGMVEIDWPARVLRLSLKGMAGGELHGQRIDLRELQVGG